MLYKYHQYEVWFTFTGESTRRAFHVKAKSELAARLAVRRAFVGEVNIQTVHLVPAPGRVIL